MSICHDRFISGSEGMKSHKWLINGYVTSPSLDWTGGGRGHILLGSSLRPLTFLYVHSGCVSTPCGPVRNCDSVRYCDSWHTSTEWAQDGGYWECRSQQQQFWWEETEPVHFKRQKGTSARSKETITMSKLHRLSPERRLRPVHILQVSKYSNTDNL